MRDFCYAVIVSFQTLAVAWLVVTDHPWWAVFLVLWAIEVGAEFFKVKAVAGEKKPDAAPQNMPSNVKADAAAINEALVLYFANKDTMTVKERDMVWRHIQAAIIAEITWVRIPQKGDPYP